MALYHATTESATRGTLVVRVSSSSADTTSARLSLSAISKQSRALSKHWLGFVSLVDGGRVVSLLPHLTPHPASSL